MMIKTDLTYKEILNNKLKKIKSCDNLLIIGSQGSGKTVSAINYSIPKSIEKKSIFFTSDSKKHINQKITPFSSNLSIVLNNNYFIFESPHFDNQERANSDKILEEIILGILIPIRKINPDVIVFDEITKYLGFQSLDNLKSVLTELLNYLKQNNIYSLFTVAQPYSSRAVELIQILKKEFSFFLDLNENPLFEDNSRTNQL